MKKALVWLLIAAMLLAGSAAFASEEPDAETSASIPADAETSATAVVDAETGASLKGQAYVDALTAASPNVTGTIDLESLNAVSGGTWSDGSTPLLVGAAIRDVTPTKDNDLLPMPGLGRLAPDFAGVINPIHSRVIAFGMGDTRALLICTESGKGPLGDQFAARISEHTGIPVEAIFFTSTLSHAAPEVSRGNLTLDESPDDGNDIKWARMTLELICDAADEALANMQPAEAYIGYGESYINVNTIYPYTLDEDGSTINAMGYNLAGDTDPTLVVIRFDDMSGDPIAFIVNYACHGTTMTGNSAYYGATGIDPDFCGQISVLLEEKYDGAVAMYTAGAAGDLGPFISNQIIYPDPYTGEYVTVYASDTLLRDEVAFMQYNDIKQVLKNGMEKVDVDVVAYAEDATLLPGEDGKDGVPLSLQLLRIGDIAFVGTTGELYHSIGAYIRENSTLPYTVIVDNTWNWENARTGYIPDDAGLMTYDAKGVLGLGGSPGYAVGTVNPYLSALANKLIADTEPASASASGDPS